MAEPLEVFIDSVRYVPAVTLRTPALEAIRGALLELGAGPGPWAADTGDHYWIEVTDSPPQTSYPELQPSVDEFIERLTATLASKEQPDGR